MTELMTGLMNKLDNLKNVNQDIDLSAIFWEIPSLQYQERKEGVGLC